MTQETALGAALKNAVQTMSKKKQADLIADYVYGKYEVFKRFKPLALGIDKDLIAAMPQYDPAMIVRVLTNHCHRPRYLRAILRGGKRFDLNNRFKGEVTAEEQAVVAQNPLMREDVAKMAQKAAEAEKIQPQQEQQTSEAETAEKAVSE